CGVEITRFSGHSVILRSSPTVFADKPMSLSASTCIAAGNPPSATCRADTLLGLYRIGPSTVLDNPTAGPIRANAVTPAPFPPAYVIAHDKAGGLFFDGPRRRVGMVEYNLDGRGRSAHKSHNHISHVAPFQQPDILSGRAFSLQSAEHCNTCERCQIIA